MSLTSRIVYLRNIVFGIEDGLVSTVGFIAGIASAGVSHNIVVVSGIVLICVEAFSMGVGSFLSEYSAEEYEQKKEVPIFQSFAGAVIMFVSYIVAGFVPLSPFLFGDSPRAFWYSIVLALIALGLLGVISGTISKVRIQRQVMRMVIIGGCAILIGVLIGKFLKI